jgi:hypothetical protein
MEKIKKYKTQIINLIVVFLILEFAIYPGLTIANTFANIFAGIGLLLLVVWGGIALYQYATSSEGGLVDMNELKEVEKMVKEKPKAKRSPKTTKSEYPLEPHRTTIKKSKTTKTK